MSELITVNEATFTATATSELESLEALNAGVTGIRLEADVEAEAIAEQVKSLKVIALDFPAFSDGRSYSTAMILRRAGYDGELRAIGDVRVDQLEQMIRCGFDAFDLADGQSTEVAKEKLQGFSHSYQTTFDRKPLFRSRS